MRSDQGDEMSTKVRIAALEHLVAALLTEASRKGVDLKEIKDLAIRSMLSSNGPEDLLVKGMACDRVKRIINLNDTV
jgi:hypothetical protein